MENKIDIGHLRALLYAGCPEISIEEQSALSNAIKAMESIDKLIQERDTLERTVERASTRDYDHKCEVLVLEKKIAELEGDSSILREQRNEAEDKLKESRKLSIDKVKQIVKDAWVGYYAVERGYELHSSEKECIEEIAKAIVELTDLWEG